ncbi:MAG: nitroreductase/quinone reductase family protein [Gordonia sp. (in: high G+C Gram-positive bacteria)]
MSIHYRAPEGFDKTFNGIVRWLVDRGVNFAGAQTLTVVGRKTGTPQCIAVNPIRIDGTEYLVAVRGNTHWVRNARAAGKGELRSGRRVRAVTLTELPVADRGPVIAAYLDKWGWEVGRFLPAGMSTKPSDDELTAHSGDIPVFVVDTSLS